MVVETFGGIILPRKGFAMETSKANDTVAAGAAHNAHSNLLMETPSLTGAAQTPPFAGNALALKDYPCAPGSIPPVNLEVGDYVLRFARDMVDLDMVCKLRFEIYNLEMGEGLEASYGTFRDVDPFDAQCHHLMVIHKSSGEMVGTYRIQTGAMALLRGGFYSAQEFDLTAFPREFTDRCVEVGRACIGRAHRNGRVLQLLWRGLARYLDWNGKRYLFGCCSLTSQDPAEGRALYRRLVDEDCLHPYLQASPLPGFECLAGTETSPSPRMPRLFEGYLNLGGLVCGEPALDRQFKTIDYLVVVDVQEMPEGIFRKMLG